MPTDSSTPKAASNGYMFPMHGARGVEREKGKAHAYTRSGSGEASSMIPADVQAERHKERALASLVLHSGGTPALLPGEENSQCERAPFHHESSSFAPPTHPRGAGPHDGVCGAQPGTSTASGCIRQ